jgi:UDP-2,3-diacylglucosamine pyrophosphatase LpxH
MAKEILSFSDTELGSGTLTDDFVADNLLIYTIEKYSKTDNPIDIVFNGDTFDFLKTPIIRDKWTFYLEHITPMNALEKLESIYKAHTKVFECWKKFLKTDKNKIYFIFGNHDYELLFPAVQERLKEILESKNIFFDYSYSEKRIYFEHGNMQDTYFTFDKKNVFRPYKNTVELNIPTLFSGFSSFFMDSKEWHPFIERINDKTILFKFNKSIKSEMLFLLIKYFGYNLIFSVYTYIIRGYFLAYLSMIKKSFVNLFKGHYDVDINDLYEGVKKIPQDIVFFGHVHEKIETNIANKNIFILDTWRDEYKISPDVWFLMPKNKRFAKIIIDKNYEIKLYDYVPLGGKLIFSKVIEDEIKYVKKIAENKDSISIKDYELKEKTIIFN